MRDSLVAARQVIEFKPPTGPTLICNSTTSLEIIGYHPYPIVSLTRSYVSRVL